MTRRNQHAQHVRDDTEVAILFVCSGNICRSPTAEAVFRKLAPSHRFEIDSAGTHGLHAGDPPDPRAIHAAQLRGYDLSGLRARKVTDDDFERFDLLLAMDQGHARWLRQQSPERARGRIRLFLEYAPDGGRLDVPDPYYGGPEGFDQVLDLVEQGVRGLLKELSPRG